jgi:hypothetical protein
VRVGLLAVVALAVTGLVRLFPLLIIRLTLKYIYYSVGFVWKSPDVEGQSLRLLYMLM